MGKSAVMAEARAFFRARGVDGFAETMNGIHFNMRLGFVPTARECWFIYDGGHRVQLTVVVGATPKDEEAIQLLDRTFSTAAAIEAFHGIPGLDKEHMTMIFLRSFNPARDTLGGLLRELVEHEADEDLVRLDVIYTQSLEGRSPREIAEMDATFGFVAGHA